MVALAACQREPVNGSENYDEGNSVNVKFVLNVSTETGKDTKTTAQYAQIGDNSFLGMDQVHLLAYNLDDHNKGTGAAASQGYFFFNPIIQEGTGEAATYKPVAATRDFNMGTLFNPGAVNSNKSSRTIELAIPLGTNSLSLYGKATRTADDDYQGSTTAKGDPKDLRTLQFTLKSRLTDKNRFNMGALFFSNMLNYFMSSGLVNENTFWTGSSGGVDHSYGFWFPVPDESVSGFPENPVDQQTVTIGSVEYTYYTGELSWKQLGTMHLYLTDGKGVDPNKFVKTAGSDGKGTNSVYYKVNALGEVLGQAYYAICAVQTKLAEETTYQELRAGSASALLRVCSDLYAIMEKSVAASPTTWEEVCAQELAVLIKERMEKYFKLNENDFNFIKTDAGAIDLANLKIAAEDSWPSSTWTTYGEQFLDEFDLSYFYNIPESYGFPQNVGLPYGAAIMQCTPDWSAQNKMDTFTYRDKIPAYGMGSTTFPIENYRFPPELMYYGNSSLRVTDSEVPESQLPTSAAGWANPTNPLWKDWEVNGSVKSSTRTVAMKNTINYGTALLRSVVRYDDGLTALLDNNHELHPKEDDNPISITDPKAGFLVTGIIIGGQADVMGWDFTRYPDSADQYKVMAWDATNQKYSGLTFDNNKFDKMIYDRVVDGYVIGQATTPIYSMVWDNYDATLPADAQSDVYIAVELLNQTGKDFWGELNMIRKNGVFYLVGKLDLGKAITAARKTSGDSAFKDLSRSDYNYPPFRPDTGETVNAPRVFMQDYVTEATLLLKENALKHAYLTVPDLRASQVSLGLSIDLAWKPGLAFTVDMGVLQ